MMILGVFGKLVRSLVRLAVLALLLAVAWVYRDQLIALGGAAVDRWSEYRGKASIESPATPELAALAQAKLDDVEGGNVSRATFSGAELQSLLVYRYGGLLPAFVDSPRIALEGDLLRLRVRIPVARIPDADALGEITGLLPDTTELDVRGKLLPAEDGRVAFAVDNVSAHRIPLPRRLVPMALEALGRQEEPGLPPDAISIPLPPGATSAYVRADSLVLLSGRAQN